MPATLPETFGRYRILRKLGQGGMGAVYLAEDTLMRRKVALKVPDFDGKESKAVLERFYREARVAAEIRHQGVCPVHDVGCIDGVHFLTMAYIEGATLHDLLRAGNPWPAVQAVEMVRRLAEALHALHQKGIVHRDLKPGNVMIEADGTPVLLDFGLARSLVAVSQKFTAEGASMGTPAYMAPEQIGGNAAAMGAHTDVYALGVILFELLTGRMPFQPGSLAELYGLILHAPRPRPANFADIGAALDQLCLDMLALSPAQRPPTMPHLIARLWQCGDNPPSGRLLEVPPAAPVLDPRTPTQPVSPSHTVAAFHRSAAAPTQAAGAPAGNAWKLAAVASATTAVVLATVWAVWLAASGAREAPPTSSAEPPKPAPPAVLNMRLAGDVTVTAGQAEVVAVEVERLGWEGEVVLAPQDVPNDLQVTAAPIPRGEKAGTIRVRALPNATESQHTIRLRAVGDNARTEQSLTVTVRRAMEPPLASLKLRLPPEVMVPAGGSETFVVEVERNNCPGEIKLSHRAGTKGVTLHLSNIAAGQNRINVEVEAGAAVQPGSYTVDILARGPGMAESEGSLTVRVKKAPDVAQEKEFTNCIGMKFVRIPAGKFTMGSPKEETDRSSDEAQHEVEITKSFYMGAYEVTQEEWEAVMGKDKILDARRLPVVNVSYKDVERFCTALNELAKNKGENCLYRLPTEAEWEYCCRGGSPRYQVFHYGDKLSTEANFDARYPYGGADKGKYLESLVEVDDPKYKPNGFGLYHMHGNVWEWCSDWYGDYPSGKATDPEGPKQGTQRVCRGGSWVSEGQCCRAAYRRCYAPDFSINFLGFRLVRVPSGGGKEKK